MRLGCFQLACLVFFEDAFLLRLGATARTVDAGVRRMDASVRQVDASVRMDAGVRRVDGEVRQVDARVPQMDAGVRLDANGPGLDAMVPWVDATVRIDANGLTGGRRGPVGRQRSGAWTAMVRRVDAGSHRWTARSGWTQRSHN